ncbi:MAG: redoxin domain-containing protein [Psittacicella sp.]
MGNKIIPGQVFPDILVKDLNDNVVNLKNNSNSHWKLIVVYRGQHCYLCTDFLKTLESLKDQFKKINVDIVVVSADSKLQLKEHQKILNVSFPIAYGLTIKDINILGGYASKPRTEQETDHDFSEPCLFVVNEKNEVQIVDISNTAFTRIDLHLLLKGVSIIKDPENPYPIRGTLLCN